MYLNFFFFIIFIAENLTLLSRLSEISLRESFQLNRAISVIRQTSVKS